MRAPTIIAIVWRYAVKPEARAEFEAAYGPAGDWAALFARAGGFLGTELLRGEGGTYLTIDRWRARADFDSFLAAHRADYDALDRRAEGWTIEEHKIGSFDA